MRKGIEINQTIGSGAVEFCSGTDGTGARAYSGIAERGCRRLSSGESEKKYNGGMIRHI